jgi:hypothetical protein
MHVLRLLKNLNDNKKAGKVETELYMADFSKAFDSVNHEILLDECRALKMEESHI